MHACLQVRLDGMAGRAAEVADPLLQDSADASASESIVDRRKAVVGRCVSMCLYVFLYRCRWV